MVTSSHLPRSPIKEVFTCPDCEKVHVTFWDNVKKIYSQEEWQYIVDQGVKALKTKLWYRNIAPWTTVPAAICRRSRSSGGAAHGSSSRLESSDV